MTTYYTLQQAEKLLKHIYDNVHPSSTEYDILFQALGELQDHIWDIDKKIEEEWDEQEDRKELAYAEANGLNVIELGQIWSNQ